MACQTEPLIETILELYEKISSLESLKPSEDVNMLFTKLVVTCIPPNPIDVTKQCKIVQEMRSKLIKLCGEAEGYLESHYSAILGSYEKPLDHLNIFPYFNNYIKLSELEFTILTQHLTHVPKRVAFVGSGPLPLTSICLASFHLTATSFHNYDIDSSANSLASALIKSDPDLSKRMFFHTVNIMDVKDELKAYDVVFLAALVGMAEEDKAQVIDHLAKNMAPGAHLMLRSAHGARAFLYPVVDPCDLTGFEMLSVFHPTDEVVNSVVVARKAPCTTKPICSIHPDPLSRMMLPSCKCSDYKIFSRSSNDTVVELVIAAINNDDSIHRVNHPRDVSEDGQQHADQKLAATASMAEENAERRKKNGE